MGEIVQFRRPEPEPEPCAKSQYELYPMPFFDRASCCTWKVQPTGNYGDDCGIGKAYAIEFPGHARRSRPACRAVRAPLLKLLRVILARLLIRCARLCMDAAAWLVPSLFEGL